MYIYVLLIGSEKLMCIYIYMRKGSQHYLAVNIELILGDILKGLADVTEPLIKTKHYGGNIMAFYVKSFLNRQ